MASVRSGTPTTSARVAETSNEIVVDDNAAERCGVEVQVESLAARIERSGRLHETEKLERTLTKGQEKSNRIPMHERWATSTPEVNLQRTIESILNAVFQRIDNRTAFSSSCDVHHIDWHCPKKLMCQGTEVECAVNVSLQEVMPNAPFGSLKFSSPYDLARLLSVLSQSHIPESFRIARLLDRNYDVLTPGGLGMAFSFYRQHCIHIVMASVAEAGVVQPEHPPRGTCDPYNTAVIADQARRYAEVHAWTSNSWKDLKPRKNLIVLPAGFEKVLDGFKTKEQVAVVMQKPEDVQPEWFAENYSSIILFSTAEFAGTMRWAGTWTLLLQQVAKGAELIALPGPENDGDWRKSVDMLRDLCEETIAQRPVLRNSIKCLLPLKSQYEMIGAGFRAAKTEHGKLFTQSAAKRFWTTTMTQHAALLKLAPFKRTPEHSISESYQRDRQVQRGRHHVWTGPQHRRAHQFTTERTPGTRVDTPLQMIGNRMFRLVPVINKRLNVRNSNYRGRGQKYQRQF